MAPSGECLKWFLLKFVFQALGGSTELNRPAACLDVMKSVAC